MTRCLIFFPRHVKSSGPCQRSTASIPARHVTLWLRTSIARLWNEAVPVNQAIHLHKRSNVSLWITRELRVPGWEFGQFIHTLPNLDRQVSRCVSANAWDNLYKSDIAFSYLRIHSTKQILITSSTYMPCSCTLITLWKALRELA